MMIGQEWLQYALKNPGIANIGLTHGSQLVGECVKCVNKSLRGTEPPRPFLAMSVF